VRSPLHERPGPQVDPADPAPEERGTNTRESGAGELSRSCGGRPLGAAFAAGASRHPIEVALVGLAEADVASGARLFSGKAFTAPHSS
jgi:hypothetical protein